MASKDPFRSDIMDKITGAAKYSGDYTASAMLHAKVLWPAATSAKVLKIDVSQAEKAPGVVRVITRADITGPNVSGMYHVQDRPILVGEGEEVRFAGDAVALVAAKSEAEAERALGLIDVQYQPVERPCTQAEAAARGDKPLEVQTIRKGDVEAGFAKAAAVVDETYEQPFLEHAYIEPDAAYADVDNFGTINVYCGTQDITQNQRMISKALGIPASKIHMKSPYVGGGFGGKHSMAVQVYIALLAHVLQRPVRLVWTREESMKYSCKRQSHTTWAKIGLAADGAICAFQARSEWPAGPYFGNYSGAMGSFIGPLCGPYNHENLDLLGNLYATNSPEVGSFRGVGAPDGTYIIETLLDKAADALGLDPVEVRRRNWMMKHEEFGAQFPGQNSRNVSAKWLMPETMDTALQEAGPLPAAAKGKRVGRGVACSMPAFCIGNSSLHKGSVAHVIMYLDGSLAVQLGFPELGNGLTGVAARLLADEMGMDEKKITVMLGDSHNTPKSGALGFSQTTVTGGNAVLDAAKKLKEKLAGYAREFLGSDDAAIHYENGNFYNGAGEKVAAWNAFAAWCYDEVKSLTADGVVVGPPEEKELYGVTPISTVADVEIDETTGQVKVLQVVSCHDIGKAIHYESARGQILGGVVMSCGMALMEEFTTVCGETSTPSFAEYLIPTSMDAPETNKVIFLETNPGKGCPQGAKGVGEHGVHNTWSAIANGIGHALGATMNEKPITPERVLRKMGKVR